MKKILFLILCTLLLPGCSWTSFFDVREVMRPAKPCDSQAAIKSAVRNYFGSEIIWKYVMVNNKYAAIIEENLLKIDLNWAVVFCQTEEHSQKIHVLFLHQKEQQWIVEDDVLHNTFDVERVLIRDVGSGEVQEIIILGESTENSEELIHVYRYDGENIKELDVTGDFVNFIKNENK